jgi:hypothetical protein
VSWAKEALEGIRKIVLIEHRMDDLSTQVKTLADTCKDLDRRLIRIEAKFELIERMAGRSRRRLPAKSGQ